jgi:hypothetical protein
MSDVETIHLYRNERRTWCEHDVVDGGPAFATVVLANCLACLLACAEYGSEARHRYEVLREVGVK